jgi:hypothetical protein
MGPLALSSAPQSTATRFETDSSSNLDCLARTRKIIYLANAKAHALLTMFLPLAFCSPLGCEVVKPGGAEPWSIESMNAVRTDATKK